jgi:CBS domain-containing protein
MTQELVTLAPETPVDAAAEVLSRAHIHGAPVVDRAGRLVGIVSVVDLVTPVARTVQGVMAWDPIVAEEDTPIEAVAALMLEHRVRRVPIVRDNKAVGIISASDIVRVFLGRQEEARS